MSKGPEVGMDLECWGKSKRPGCLDGGSEGQSGMRQTGSWKGLGGRHEMKGGGF